MVENGKKRMNFSCIDRPSATKIFGIDEKRNKFFPCEKYILTQSGYLLILHYDTNSMNVARTRLKRYRNIGSFILQKEPYHLIIE